MHPKTFTDVSPEAALNAVGGAQCSSNTGNTAYDIVKTILLAAECALEAMGPHYEICATNPYACLPTL